MISFNKPRVTLDSRDFMVGDRVGLCRHGYVYFLSVDEYLSFTRKEAEQLRQAEISRRLSEANRMSEEQDKLNIMPYHAYLNRQTGISAEWTEEQQVIINTTTPYYESLYKKAEAINPHEEQCATNKHNYRVRQ